METAIWILVLIAGVGVFSVLRALDQLINEVRQMGVRLDFKAEGIFNEQAVQGLHIRDLANEAYLLRRIAEESTGTSKESVYAQDKQRMEAKMEQLREVIQKRDAADGGK